MSESPEEARALHQGRAQLSEYASPTSSSSSYPQPNLLLLSGETQAPTQQAGSEALRGPTSSTAPSCLPACLPAAGTSPSQRQAPRFLPRAWRTTATQGTVSREPDRA